MSKSPRWSKWLPPIALSAVLLGGWIAADDDDDAPNDREAAIELSEFMRRKLEASSQILEGLCTEDSALITQGTRTLQEMGAAEKWRVSTDPMYRQFSGDFEEIVQELNAAAEEDNYDRVALKWMDATMCCIDCHRFTRNMLIVGEADE
jgi:hypothetical protein